MNTEDRLKLALQVAQQLLQQRDAQIIDLSVALAEVRSEQAEAKAAQPAVEGELVKADKRK